MVKSFTPIYPSTAGSPDDKLYFQQLRERLAVEAGLEWEVINKKGSNLTDLETHNHAGLQEIGEADDTDDNEDKDKHVSNNDMRVIAEHIAAAAAHSANGDIVGNEDYATITVGGVVKKAATQGDANTTVTGSAGAAYTATEQAMINALKIDVESLATTVNALIDKLQTAGLME